MGNKQTAVEWLIEQFEKNGYIGLQAEKQAKQMEKEMIMKAARQCHFEGVRQSAKTSEEYIDYAEQYYNETYNK